MSYDQNLVCLDNHRQKNWNKTQKSSNIGQSLKTLISTFENFFTPVAKL